MFGPPWRTGVEDGRPTWSYGTYKTGLGDTLSRDLVIRFDVDGTVASRITSYNVCYTKLLREMSTNILKSRKRLLIFGLLLLPAIIGGVCFADDIGNRNNFV